MKSSAPSWDSGANSEIELLRRIAKSQAEVAQNTLIIKRAVIAIFVVGLVIPFFAYLILSFAG